MRKSLNAMAAGQLSIGHALILLLGTLLLVACGSDDPSATPAVTTTMPTTAEGTTQPEVLPLEEPVEEVPLGTLSRSFEELTFNDLFGPAEEAVVTAEVSESRSALSFGLAPTEVEESLTDQFGPLDFIVDSNLDDVAVVADPTGDYLLTRSNVGNDSRKQWNILIEPSQEAYLVYRLYLEPGFDAGDGNGDEGSPAWGTGVKLPGLMRGDPGDNSGGVHTAGGFSGRLMIRGTQSSGSIDAPRDGLSLAAYVYGQQINGESITSGFGRDYYFLDGFETPAFQGITDGMVEGVGDPRIWELEEGEWITIVLGYRVDGGNGWFKAWTATGNEALAPRLFIPNINWVGGDGVGGADSILFQQFWGGSGSVWYPDEVSYTRFKDFAVFNNEADALTAAGFLTTPIPSTSTADAQ